jgi:hypothetical protein
VGAVSVAVSIVFALSWPALIRAVERRQWTLAPMATAALVLTGAYSVTAALGSASGGRIDASATEQLIIEQRTRAQISYAAAQAELAALRPSRSVVELEFLISSSSGHARSVCSRQRHWHTIATLLSAQQRDRGHRRTACCYIRDPADLIAVAVEQANDSLRNSGLRSCVRGIHL